MMSSNENSFAILSDEEINGEDVIETRECEMTRDLHTVSRWSSTENLVEMSSGRPSKRNRVMSTEEVWTTVGKKAKKPVSSDENDLTNKAEEKIEICLTCPEKLPKQFGLAKMMKAENIKNVIKIKYINAYKVLIHFSQEESAEEFLLSKLFNENGFKCQRTLEVNQSYGVIKDVDLHLSDDEICEELRCETEILGIKRLKRKNTNDGLWETSESVRICFKGSLLPSYVYICDTRAQVHPYTFPVTQCSRCWRFGHTIKMCPSLKVICPKCTKSHVNCETTEFKCNNCTGRHMAMAKICPVFLKEKRIREIMSEFNCSYKKALTMFPPSAAHHGGQTQDLNKVIGKDTSEDIIEESRNTPSTPSIIFPIKHISNKNQNLKKNPKGQKIKEKRNNKITERNEDYLEDVFESNESDTKSEDGILEGNRNNYKEKISWSQLFKKIKNKIFEKGNASWEDTLKECVGIVMEGLLSIFMKFIADQPCCNFIKQLWTTATQVSQ
ncbi:uncharacterized protein LOC106141397 [Amyelois transitella]|uniref:uncharacterized protein LOC106141397 n=1 Tax=Amyelois transitella TaxID=680683 RepID=UPI00067B7B4D|nr:uncharacterized protein LOC106141397 [Amyelois transitella]